VIPQLKNFISIINISAIVSRFPLTSTPFFLYDFYFYFALIKRKGWGVFQKELNVRSISNAEHFSHPY